jgi:hypothetical protein
MSEATDLLITAQAEYAFGSREVAAAALLCLSKYCDDNNNYDLLDKYVNSLSDSQGVVYDPSTTLKMQNGRPVVSTVQLRLEVLDFADSFMRTNEYLLADALYLGIMRTSPNDPRLYPRAAKGHADVLAATSRSQQTEL